MSNHLILIYVSFAQASSLFFLFGAMIADPLNPVFHSVTFPPLGRQHSTYAIYTWEAIRPTILPSGY